MMTELEFQLSAWLFNPSSRRITELEVSHKLVTALNLVAEFVPHPDFIAWLPIDPAIGNSFGSYAELGNQHNYRAEAFLVAQTK